MSAQETQVQETQAQDPGSQQRRAPEAKGARTLTGRVLLEVVEKAARR